MLIALELAGFKSFAEKTRFEFPDGITVIVGPNGSGKSNVVDSIKWVLGSQSPKALRGQEMADVIFKGSSGSGRKPAGSAEATLVFDNRSQALPIDADEVQVTRRVYRSGESEYLINHQPARLKDIRNLFRGTGVGVDAYSLIEQGKVDRMLQASPKERRVIFEEAAGISRFNAKKAEAARRLEKVDQNLVRLKDIVDEVHSRLNALKGQASKAQKFRDMTNRLKDIRLSLGWTEYCDWQDKQHAAQTLIESLTDQRHLQQQELATVRSLAQAADNELHQVAARIQELESTLQETLQQIAVAENQRQSLTVRIEETQEQWQRQSERLAGLQQRADESADELKSANEGLDLAKSGHLHVAEQTRLNEDEVGRLLESIGNLNARNEHLRTEHVRLWRQVTEKTGLITQLQGTFGELTQAIQHADTSLQENAAAQKSARTIAERTAEQLKETHARHVRTQSDLEQAKATLVENRDLLARYQEAASVLQGRLEGASQRLEILEELQHHLEGVDAGARHVLNLKGSNELPALQSVYGLVADLIQVDVNLAPLIDTALGPAAHALVLRDGQLIQLVRAGQLDVPGRLTMMRMDRLPQARFGEKVQLDSVPGVIGRADQLIRCRREVQPLVRYLLGTTWLVESLEIALELGHFRGAGLRFVTADCKLVEADGTITVGALTTSSALVSRASEIRNARDAITDFKAQYSKMQGEVERVQGRLRELNPNIEKLEKSAASLATELAHQQATAQNAAAKLNELEKQASHWQATQADLRVRHAGIEPEISETQSSIVAMRDQIAAVEIELASHDQWLKDHQNLLSSANAKLVATRVELARVEQRLDAATTLVDQATRNYQERTQAVSELQQELQRLVERKQLAESDIGVLNAKLETDRQLAAEEESQLDALADCANSLQERRADAVRKLDMANRSLDRLTQQVESTTNEVEHIQKSIQLLVQRYQDDFQIDLASIDSVSRIEAPEQIAELNGEAARLRQDIASVGEINMAALAELDDLQQRYDHLNGQFEDLRAAKESLQRIIHKINGDSRRLFMETLEAIRQNFQKLYRKSFGGGHADIVLEEGVDVLECGIDIIATPPGKTSFSNSLLSGGEKALTAVALLLAIFQYRPSPFCVLDEVDAPFDEANIGRFVNVLTEFLDWTKFIIVTHSKKTMTAATTLYGVTMQESGVSKQVAVRFEDVNEKGEILRRKAA